MSELIRPRRATEIIDAAIQLYRRAPSEYMVVAAVVYVPYVIARLYLVDDPFATGTGAEPFAGALTLGLLALLLNVAMEGPLLIVASEQYLGRRVHAIDALKAALPRFPLLLLANVFRWVLIGLGYVFLFVPGVYLTALTFGVSAAIMIERTGVPTAFERSASLSRDLKIHILGTAFLGFLITTVLSAGGSVLFSITGSRLVQEVGLAALTVVVSPIGVLVKAILYYDTRIRREGFDLEVMTAGEDAAAAATP